MYMAAAADTDSGGDVTYMAAAMLIAADSRRAVVPVRHWRTSANLQGGRPICSLGYQLSERGVRHAQ
jgi:hypothetical protein